MQQRLLGSSTPQQLRRRGAVDDRGGGGQRHRAAAQPGRTCAGRATKARSFSTIQRRFRSATATPRAEPPRDRLQARRGASSSTTAATPARASSSTSPRDGKVPRRVRGAALRAQPAGAGRPPWTCSSRCFTTRSGAATVSWTPRARASASGRRAPVAPPAAGALCEDRTRCCGCSRAARSTRRTPSTACRSASACRARRGFGHHTRYGVATANNRAAADPSEVGGTDVRQFPATACGTT